MARNQLPVVYGGPDDRMTFREKVIRHLSPWCSLLLLWVAGLLAYLAWGGSPALPLITPTLAIAFFGLAGLAWMIGKRHSYHGAVHLAVTIAAIGIWLVLSVTVSPINGTVLTLLGLFGPVTALSWNVRLEVAKPRKGESEPRSPKAWAKGFLTSVGIKGASFNPTEIGAARIAGELELDGTQTADEMQKRAAQLEAALEAPKGGVRISTDPTNSGRAELSATLKNILGVSTPWPGPSAVGGTPWDPIPMGLYETGEELKKIIADEAGAKHEIAQGINGSGKSSGDRIEFMELMTRRETGIILLDTRKAAQTFGRAVAGIAKVVTKDELGSRVIARLASNVVPDRSAYLAAHGYDAWKPGCGLTFLRIQIEEAASFLAKMDNDDDIISLAQTARSVGIEIKLSMQRPSHDQIPTSLRSEFGSVTCYGISADEAVCLLPDEVVSAGANPQRWTNTQPGCNYYAGTGIPVAQASVPLRNYEVTNDVMAVVANHFGPLMDPIDPVTVKAFGKLWDQMGDPAAVIQAEFARVGGGQVLPALAAGATNSATNSATNGATNGTSAAHPSPTSANNTNGTNEIDDADDEESKVTVTEDDMHITTPDPDPNLNTSIEDNVDPLDTEITFGSKADEVPVEQARQIVRERIDGMESMGSDHVTAPDFGDLVEMKLRSRAWFRKELIRLCEIGRLRDLGGGKFAIVRRQGDPDPSTEDADMATDVNSDMEDAA